MCSASLRRPAIDLHRERCLFFGRCRGDPIFQVGDFLLELALQLLGVLNALINSLTEGLPLEDDVEHRIHRPDVGSPEQGHDQRKATIPPIVQRYRRLILKARTKLFIRKLFAMGAVPIDGNEGRIAAGQNGLPAAPVHGPNAGRPPIRAGIRRRIRLPPPLDRPEEGLLYQKAENRQRAA